MITGILGWGRPRLTRVTRRGRQPLRRAAPTRLTAHPGWLALVVASMALLTASLVAPTLFARAADSAALDTGLAAVADDAFTTTTADTRATWDSVLDESSYVVVRHRLAGLPSYAPPVVNAVGGGTSARGINPVVLRGGSVETAALYYRDGAVAALGGTPSARGVWLPDEVAAALDVRAGDFVSVGLLRSFGASITAPTLVAGTFTRARLSALPQQLADEPGLSPRDLPYDPDNPGAGRPIMIADRDTFQRLSIALGYPPLFTADLRLDDDVTPDEARVASAAVQRVATDAFDDRTTLAQASYRAKPAPTRVSVTSGLPDIVAEADSTATAARDQAAPFAQAGIVLSVVVMCAATVLLGRSRRREQDLLSGLGVRPHEVAALTAAELLVPAVAGALVGAAAAWTVVTTLGPPGELPGALPGAAARAAVGAVLAVALGAACAGVAAWYADRRATSSRLGVSRRRVPWEAVLLAATVVSGAAVVTTDVARRPASPLAVVFPLLLAGSVSLLVLRGLDLAGARRWAPGRVGSPRWLAGQRSRSTATETAAVTLALAVGLAILGYSLAVHRGVTLGVEDKVSAMVGAQTAVDVGDDLSRDRPRRPPDNPVAGSAVVYRGQGTLPPLFGTQPVLAIDTRTFAAAADWGGTSTMARGRELLGRLREPGYVVPVLLSGDTTEKVGDQGILDFYEEWSLPYKVVGVLPAFPGSETDPGDVAVVVEARRLWPFMPPPLDPRLLPKSDIGLAGRFSTWLWSSRSAASVSADLTRAGITPTHSLLRSSATTDSQLLAAGWSSGYVVALGGCALLLVGAAALVLAARLADRDAVSDVLLRRMSYGAGDLAAARTWEVALAIAAALAAAVVSLAAMVLAPSTVEPAVHVAPLTRPLTGWPDAVVLTVACLVLVAAAGAVARRRAGDRVAAEVLRGNG